MAQPGFFEKKGKVSLWLGIQEPDVAAMKDIDILKDLCGVAHYNVDDQEVAGISGSFPRGQVTDLLSQFSYASSFLAGALPLAVDESGTPIWLALKTDASTFWIVDAFPSDAERQTHLNGPIAAALMGKAEELLAVGPEVGFADVLGAKPA
jgi:hypothetical protein